MNWIIMPEWNSVNISIYCLVIITALVSGFIERKGLMTVQYSKFRSGEGISSRTGMFIIYFVPFLAHIPALHFFTELQLSDAQIIFSAAILIHFGKRCYEVLFIHKYSGPIDIMTVIQITGGYTLLSIYAAYISPVSLKHIDSLLFLGVALFCIGQAGNFYHHKLLADLREKEEGYFIPRGGFFEKVTCPHYFFEIIAWLGVAFISRHLDMFILTLIMAAYLTGRSSKASQWYREKFEDYPVSRKNIFPLVY